MGPLQKKKLKLWRLPKIEILWKDGVPPPLTQLRRGELQAKHMGLNQGAIGNTLGEHIGNLGNILRT